MSRACTACGQPFEIADADRAFYSRMDVPEPTHCYFCRMIRRLAMRNERHLYHRKCDLTGKTMISAFSSDKPFPVFSIDAWWSDQWDALSFGRDFDFSRPFFEQFTELRDTVPRLTLQHQKPMENSDYCNCASRNKNCYLTFSTNLSEDCYYGSWVNRSRDCVDNLNIDGCELCYECVSCRECYNVRYSRDCSSCSDSMFLRDCVGCKDCFGCTSLAQGRYVVYNKQLTKAAYESFFKQINTGSFFAVEQAVASIRDAIGTISVKEWHGESLENCTGDYLFHCRDAECCFECDECEDIRYCMCTVRSKSCMDYSYWGGGAELLYECQACGYEVYHLRFCNLCWSGCRDLDYCDHCFSSQSCFGCVGLRQNRYCILNKQYSAEEYDAMLPRVIAHLRSTGEWGELFPIRISPFSYNETLAMEHEPISATQARSRGVPWHEELDEKKTDYIGSTVAIPDDIATADDGITRQILRCQETGRPYKIVAPELAFYRRLSIPLPRVCPDARHARRLQQRTPRWLWTRNCDACGKDIRTSYAPHRPERVLCEHCYQTRVFG